MNKADFLDKWKYRMHHEDHDEFEADLKEVVKETNWQKKAPDQVGWWMRLNVIHKPEMVYVFEDWRNTDKALCVDWGWSGERNKIRIQDNLHKIEHFYWTGPFNIPPREKISNR